MATKTIIWTNTALTRITIPLDYGTPSTVETIGGGSGASRGSGGVNFDHPGAGGAYSREPNPAFTPGAVVACAIGIGGPGATTSQTLGTAGGDTWIATNNTATVITSPGVVCGAKGADVGSFAGGVVGTKATGGQSTGGIGSVKYSGGGGGTIGGFNSGGGGAAAGPTGDGGSGASTQNNVNTGGAGGGGADGGGNGISGTTSSGGNGGANNASAGAGLGGTSSGVAGGAGTLGGGGGGGFDNAAGGNGSTEQLWDSTHGPGSGGGGGGNVGSPGGGNGANYGGGGGAGWVNAPAGDGGQGIIVLTYTPAVTNTGAFFFGI